MWCANCQSEVAAEASPETGEVRCASCGNEIAGGKFARLDQNLRQARELLDRWSREPLLEPYGPLSGKSAATSDELKHAPVPTPTEPADVEPRFRVDAPHDGVADREPTTDAEFDREDSPAVEPAPLELSELPQKSVSTDPPSPTSTLPSASTTLPDSRRQRIEPAHHPTWRDEPHFDIQRLIEQNRQRTPRGSSFMVMAGQWLSYLGVLGLTAGASLVIYGYFGNEPSLTPKGWMLTTAGQMLLFLGIVTLISGGMEQSNDEMSRKIEFLGEQMLRFEKHARDEFLRGPKIPAQTYAENPPQRASSEKAQKTASTESQAP